METNNLSRITSLEGYSYQVGHLVSMLTYTRNTTFDLISGLSVHHLDYLDDDLCSNSIASLLSHIAAGEFLITRYTFFNRQLTDAEWELWGPALWLGQSAKESIKNQPLNHYIDQMNKVREETLQLFQALDDSWLYEDVVPSKRNKNKYLMWFRVIEDELHHRGQISLIKRRIQTMPHKS